MKKIKKQTSRFFREAPSADEQVAAAVAGGGEGVFNAGIQGPPPAIKKKSMYSCSFDC
jgi:hypothetical protein